MEELNLTQQKHTFTNQKKCTTTQNKHKKLKPCLAASYDIQPGNGEGLFLFRHFINLSLTYLLRHLPTYLQLGDPYGTSPWTTTTSTTTTTATITILWPLYISRHTQLRPGRFWWSKVLLPTQPCWQKLAHWIREKMLEFSSTVLPPPSPYRLNVHTLPLMKSEITKHQSSTINEYRKISSTVQNLIHKKTKH